MTSRIIETNKDYVLPHGCHIQKWHHTWPWQQCDPFTFDHHELSHCVLSGFAQCPIIFIPGQESKKNKINSCKKIRLQSLITLYLACLMSILREKNLFNLFHRSIHRYKRKN